MAPSVVGSPPDRSEVNAIGARALPAAMSQGGQGLAAKLGKPGAAAALFLFDRQALRAEIEARTLGQPMLLIELIADRGEHDSQHADDQVKNIVASHARPQIAPSDLLAGSLSLRTVSRAPDFPIDPVAAPYATRA
jgi:hypothetical protein